MRLIDADALLENAGVLGWIVGGRGNGKSILSLAKAWLFNEVNAAPTINPDDLRQRGEWITIYDVMGVISVCQCSNCKMYEEMSKGRHKPYCPECGAVMNSGER